MLNAISWQQYLTAILILSAAWYSYIGLRYYRAELAAWLKLKPSVPGVVPPVLNNKTVMGEAKPEPGTGLYPAEELILSAAEPDDISDQTLPRGPADDLLDEARVLVDAFAESGNKREFLSFLKLLLDKYEVFCDEISLPVVIRSVQEYAQSRLPFPLENNEFPLTF